MSFRPDGVGVSVESEGPLLWLRVLQPDDPGPMPERGTRILLDDAFVHTAGVFNSPLLGFASAELGLTDMLAAMPLSDATRQQLGNLIKAARIYDRHLPDRQIGDCRGQPD